MTASSYALLSDRAVLAAVVAFILAMVVLAVHQARRPRRSPGVPARSDRLTSLATASLGRLPSERGAEAGADGSAQISAGSVRTAELARIVRSGHALLGIGGALLVLAVVCRGLASGRAPWSNMYEFVVVGTLTTVATYLVLVSRPRTRPVGVVGVWVAAAAALFLGLAITVLYTPAAGLIPVLDSAWLVVHVAAAIVAGGLFTVGAMVSVFYLVSLRSRGRAPGHPSARSSDSLDQAAQTAYTIAFPIWTFAVMAGAIWAENSWGRYWGWDPKETWAFITWVLYAAYLHAQATGGWRGKKATWLALAGYLAFLFNFVGVNVWIGGLHSYAGL